MILSLPFSLLQILIRYKILNLSALLLTSERRITCLVIVAYVYPKPTLCVPQSYIHGCKYSFAFDNGDFRFNGVFNFANIIHQISMVHLNLKCLTLSLSKVLYGHGHPHKHAFHFTHFQFFLFVLKLNLSKTIIHETQLLMW